MDANGERVAERLLQAIRGKVLAKKGPVADAQKLIIEAYRRNDDSFEIDLTIKTR